jgi:hypothetical protein
LKDVCIVSGRHNIFLATASDDICHDKLPDSSHPVGLWVWTIKPPADRECKYFCPHFLQTASGSSKKHQFGVFDPYKVRLHKTLQFGSKW